MMATRRSSSGGGSAERGEVKGSFQVPLHHRDTGIGMAKSIDAAGPAWAKPVMIGKQAFSVLIDTGSADLWVAFFSSKHSVRVASGTALFSGISSELPKKGDEIDSIKSANERGKKNWAIFSLTGSIFIQLDL